MYGPGTTRGREDGAGNKKEMDDPAKKQVVQQALELLLLVLSIRYVVSGGKKHNSVTKNRMGNQ